MFVLKSAESIGREAHQNTEASKTITVKFKNYD